MTNHTARWKAARRWVDWLEFASDDSALFTSGEPIQEDGRWRTKLRRWSAPSLANIDGVIK